MTGTVLFLFGVAFGAVIAFGIAMLYFDPRWRVPDVAALEYLMDRLRKDR